jgi:hypothetical protein
VRKRILLGFGDARVAAAATCLAATTTSVHYASSGCGAALAAWSARTSPAGARLGPLAAVVERIGCARLNQAGAGKNTQRPK